MFTYASEGFLYMTLNMIRLYDNNTKLFYLGWGIRLQLNCIKMNKTMLTTPGMKLYGCLFLILISMYRRSTVSTVLGILCKTTPTHTVADHTLNNYYYAIACLLNIIIVYIVLWLYLKHYGFNPVHRYKVAVVKKLSPTRQSWVVSITLSFKLYAQTPTL